MTCIVNGYAVFYEIKGSGPVILCLHGWGDNSSTFKELSKSLSAKYTVITLDLLGFGKSDAPKETFNLEKYAEFVAEFLNKIDTKHVFGIIGHSNGGAIAIRGLASGILRSEVLVLLASSGIRSTYKGRKKVMRFAAKAAKMPTKILPDSAQIKLKKYAYQKVGSDMFVAENLQDTFKQVVSEDLVHESAMIHQPTLLLYGSEDQSTPVSYGEKYHKQIENSELIIIPKADHFLHHTHAGEVERYVSDFLERS